MQTSAFQQVEHQVRGVIFWIQLAVEAAGALVIAIGVLLAGFWFARAWLTHGQGDFRRMRITLAHYLALALEFLLAADILATAISPTWDQLGKLAVIAAIRTGLNFFLMREMQDEPGAADGAGPAKARPPAAGADRPQPTRPMNDLR